MMYLKVFAVGGSICLIGQLLINKTKITSARILVTFLVLGVVLEAVGLFSYIEKFAGAGITIPITGFGSTLAKGAIEGSKISLYHAVTYGLAAVSAGLTAAIFFGFIFALIFKSRSKKL
ncbi:MAG: SpoVA/SpoVAEb family sporulation membrane protein [Clostridia bacterium]|nr:SpoVA/SpoVAEb family sporulation membrane protein [Clostridia bacterium]